MPSSSSSSSSSSLLLFVVVTAASASCAVDEEKEAEAVAIDSVGLPTGAPTGVALGDVLPAFVFDGVDGNGVVGRYAFADVVDDSVFVVAVHGGSWCGTCRGFVARDDNAVDVDIVLADDDNGPVATDDAVRWHDDFANDRAVFIDREFVLQPLLAGAGATLPLVVVVNDGRVAAALSNPSRATLHTAIARARGDDDAPEDEDLVDGRLTRDEWALLQTTTVPSAPPADRSNAVADDANAAALGAALFADVGLSPSNTIACATCHDRDRGYSDGRRTAVGVATGARRTPSIALAAHQRWQFWDGRADSLWSQALGPFENDNEMASSRVFVARRVVDAHADAFRAAFPNHVLPDTSAWPADGKPGDAGYDALADDVKDAITAVFVDAGKAIAAHERTFRTAPNRFDAYLAGDVAALADDEKLGLVLFARSGCLQCHWGPRLTDDAFHAVSLGAVHDVDDRAAGHAAWRASPFNRGGVWSDAPVLDADDDGDDDDAGSARRRGQQKTPPLRGVADGNFFTHDGSFDDIVAVTTAYGLASKRTDGAPREPWLPFFGETAQWGLVPFLKTLTATPR